MKKPTLSYCVIFGKFNFVCRKTKMAINLYATCGNSKNYQKTLSRIRDLLQLAMWIELYTIPPYLTAYFSVKTKSKTKVRSLLKRLVGYSIINEKETLFMKLLGVVVCLSINYIRTGFRQ